jgi:hypothetical protein
MKTQSSEKEVEAGQNLKRVKTTKGKSTVNGKAVFENGKLTKPKVEQEIADFVEKKKQLTKPSKEKVEDLPDEDAKWCEYITINNVKNKQKREEIKQIITETLKLPNVKWSRIGGDFVAKTNNRIILRLCAMTRPPTFSAMCPSLGPSISRYTYEEVIGAIPKAHEMFYKLKIPTKKGTKPQPQKSINGEEAVAILKAKVEGLSKSSKGFVVPKEVRVTDPSVKAWIKENCYSAVADKIMLNRVP